MSSPAAVVLLDLRDPRHAVADKTIAGGLGTATDYGSGAFGAAFLRLKAGSIRLPDYHIAYVAAQLRAVGRAVRLETDVAGVRDGDLVVLFTSIPSLRVDRAALRELRGRPVRTVVVGTLASIAPEEFGDADVVVRGEPEAWIGGGARGEGVVDAGFVADLDALPMPDWSVFPRLEGRYRIVTARGAVVPVVTSRGCPYPCGHYCPYPLEEGRTMRYRSAESVVAELRGLADGYGVRAVKFRDPILTLDRRRTEGLLAALESSDVGTIWGCETHLDTLDEDLLAAMARAGCVTIQTGIESTDPAVLAAAHRRTASPGHTRAMLEAAADRGIRVAVYFMLGLPGDTLEGMRRTLADVHTIPASFLQITVATPYPGTAFWEETRARRGDIDLADLDQYSAALPGDGWTNADLRGLMSDAYRRFYLHPSRLRHELRVRRGLRTSRPRSRSGASAAPG